MADNLNTNLEQESLNILLNLNEDNYREDKYFKLSEQLKKLIEKDDIKIDRYFEEISDNYSGWGSSFFISNISIKEDKPYLLFRPKPRPKLEDFFPDDFIIGFKVSPNMNNETKQYKPFFIDEFVKFIKSEKRDWEIEAICNFYKSKPDRNKSYINEEFVKKLPLISYKTQEKLDEWYEYLEWKYHADISTSMFFEVVDKECGNDSYKFKLNKKLPNNIVKYINDYGIYLFSKEDVKVQNYEDNFEEKQRLIYINKTKRLTGEIKIINNRREYIFDNYFDGLSKDDNDRFSYRDNFFTINIKNIKSFKEVDFIVFIEKDKRFTNTKLISNIDLFKEQGGYAPFLSSYLFDIKNARLHNNKPNKLEFHNKKLTDEQKKAVQIMCDAPDIALIQGPPGTGKTTVIAECIYQYVKQGKKVMLTSESNDAVDNALERLSDDPNVIPLRLVSGYRNDDSKFSKGEATKTYYQETLSNPSRKVIEIFNDKEKSFKENEKYYEDFKLLNDKFKKHITNRNDIQNNIDILNRDYKNLETKQKAVELSIKSNQNFEKLKEKIKNPAITTRIEGEGLNENIINIFSEEVLNKIKSLTTNFFKLELTDSSKSTFVRTNYIFEGLDSFSKFTLVFDKAREDLSFLKSIESTEIISKDISNKIEELEYKIQDAEDKLTFDDLRKEKSKLEREKGLSVDKYINEDVVFISQYFIDYMLNKYKKESEEIKNILTKLEEIDKLSDDILKTEISMKKIEKEISSSGQNLGNKNKLLEENNNELEILKSNISDLTICQQNLEKNCQKYLTKIKSFQLFDSQELLHNLELAKPSISDTKKNLEKLKLTKLQIKQYLDYQKYLKQISKELDDLIIMINEKKLALKDLEETKSDLIVQQKNKDELLHNIQQNKIKIQESKDKLEEFKDSWTITKIINGFNKKDEERNIASLDETNQNLRDEINKTDIKIVSLNDKIKNSESKIKIKVEEIETKLDSIKKIEPYKFSEIITNLNLDNIEYIYQNTKNNIWSDIDLENFPKKQKNLIPILDEIDKLKKEFDNLANNLSSIEKLKNEKNSMEKNISTIKNSIKNIKEDLKSKNKDKVDTEKQLKEINSSYKSLKEIYGNYKEEELLNRQQSTKDNFGKLLEIDSYEKKYDFVNYKLGQNANKEEAIKLLNYFIETFKKEKDIYDNSLKRFIEESERYMLNNPIEEFDENIITDIKNQISDKENELNKLNLNINNVENEIDGIKLKLKKESTSNDEILKYLEEQMSQNEINDEEKSMLSLIENWVKNIYVHTPTKREEDVYLKNINVVGITLNASEFHLRDIKLEYFDVVIVDEISKSTPPEYLRGMMRAKKAILVGDHRQLPPLFSYHGQDFSFEDGMHDEIDNEILSLENFNKYKKLVTASQFMEFYKEANDKIKFRLTKQFRMHTDIMDIINCFYGGQLTQGFSEDKEVHNKEKVHNIYIQNFIEKKDHAVWVDTSRIFGKEDNRQIQDFTTKKNPFEAFLAIEALKKIDEALYNQHKDGDKKLSIGIISFYLGQVNLLKEKLKKFDLKYFDKESIMISTVDSFQGRDRDIILVNLISTKRKVGKDNFVSSFQRINVAFSRAKKLLVIFGSKDIFEDYEVDIPNIKDETIIKKEKVYGKIANIINRNGGGKDPSSISEIDIWNKQKNKYGYKNDKN